MKKLATLLLPVLTFSFASLAQVAEPNWCATDKAEADYGKAHPEYLIQKQQFETQLRAVDQAAYKNGSQPKTTGTVYIIPVVFHIIHEGGPENISDAQVYDCVKIINEDFRKQNADTANTIAKFKGIAADCEIEVRLATIDPNGNCTKGIEHIYNVAGANDGGLPSKINQWPPSKYVNVWVVKQMTSMSTASGYTNGPGTGASAGIVMIYSYVGSILTSAAQRKHGIPHEFGHYFSLAHTWGGTNSPEVACGDDGVADTPITKGFTTCDITAAICTPGVVENVQNFMEYSFCSTMFTQGQKTRMRSAITSSSLSSLWQNSNLIATGTTGTPVLCAADFAVQGPDTICTGTPVVFQDLSYNGTITTWNWTFTGATPSSSTLAAPSVTYNTPGVYNVSLTVGNGSASKTVSKNNVIVAKGPIGNSYTQTFEGYTFPGTDFSVVNRDNGATWTKTTSAGFSGTSSVVITGSASGQVDDLIGPGVNLSVMSSPEFSFRVAYAQKSSSTTDKLQVYLSTDCGVSWAQRYVKSGSSLATAPITTGTFTPTSAQWRKDVVGLTNSFTTKTNVMFLFRFTSAAGNSIYIDDINVVDLLGIKEDEFGSRVGLNIHPNPVEENSVIAFKLSERTTIAVKIYDVLGRDVATVVNKDLSAGDYSFPVAKDASGLKQGIYFVKLLMDNNKSYTQKIIVQ